MNINDNEESVIESNEFKKKLFERLNGISSKFRLNYPFNPKICYDYPKINPIICQNILNSLIKYPKFYIQTLHLMNKMNLPCPLVPFVREPCSFFLALNQPEQKQDLSSSSESEIEMDMDQEKRMLDSKHQIESNPKRLKVKSLLKSINTTNLNDSKKGIDIKEVFESIENQEKSKSKNLQTRLDYDRVVIPPNQEDAFPKIIPANKKIENIEPVKQDVASDIEGFIKKEDLEKNRLKLSELRELPIFKSYDKGEKNTRLYLKNLSKKISEDDLKFIYGRYINWSLEEHKNAFDVRLMKEGRMKGQAFISFPNEEIADKALNETIGYLLDSKPIIIQFARSAKP